MKIDTGTIEGFDTMTPEQQVAALTGLDLPEPDYSGYVKKAVFDKKASEAATLSRQLKERMSEEEKAQATQQETLDGLQAELEIIRSENAALKRAQSVAETTAQLVGMGYEKDLAAKAAAALVDGDIAKVVQCQADFTASREKQLRTELLMQTPAPPNAGGTKETEELAIAKRSGQARAAAQKASDDVMKHYL